MDNSESQPTMKICGVCQEDKPTSDFGAVKGIPGASRLCKACNRRRSAMSYAKRKGKVYTLCPTMLL